MVDNRLQVITNRFGVAVEEVETTGSTHFLDISNDNGLVLTIQYVNDRIYCVYFRGNQFFELPEDSLYEITAAILAGSYRVDRNGFLRKRNTVIIKVGDKDILPERVESN